MFSCCPLKSNINNNNNNNNMLVYKANRKADWVNLRSRWFRLNSKTGKKEKERGEVQATVQFTRNNLTASMYHLAMKERGHSAFSKLKERMRGKKRSAADEGVPHPTPASSTTGLTAGTGAPRNRLPSDGGGEEEYEDDEGGEGRRNKMRTFFLRGKLRKSSETRSSSSLGSESSESSSRGGSLSPTAGISVVATFKLKVCKVTEGTSEYRDHTADISPKLSPDHSEFGSECHEITIAVPSIYRNGVHHTCDTLPLRPGPGEPVAPAKVSPSVGLEPQPPRRGAPRRGAWGRGCGRRRRWSFDKPGEDEKAAIAAALEKSGPMVGDEEEQQEEEEEEPSGESALSVATGAARESYDQKQQQQQKKKKNKKESAGGRDGSEPGQEKHHKGWFGSKEAHAKPSPVVSSKLGPIPESYQPPPPLLPCPHPVRPLTPEERRAPEGRSVLEKLRSTIHPGRSGQLSEAEPERRKSMTEGAGSYYHLTHNELVALLVRREAELEAQRAEFERQTTLLSRREVELRRLKPQVRDLENYIDTLLVRIMEQTPTLLQVRSKF
ncbi:hypothetical protein CRUP_016387, partial [Coryphaenoides rupestris]